MATVHALALMNSRTYKLVNIVISTMNNTIRAFTFWLAPLHLALYDSTAMHASSHEEKARVRVRVRATVAIGASEVIVDH